MPKQTQGECLVSAAIHATGAQDWRIQAYGPRTTPRPDGQPYIVVRIGTVLVYLNDRDAAIDWRNAFVQAGSLIDKTFETGSERPWEPGS